MKIEIKQRVLDTKENKIIEPGTVIERDDKRGKDFLKYGIEVKEELKKKSRKKKE